MKPGWHRAINVATALALVLMLAAAILPQPALAAQTETLRPDEAGDKNHWASGLFSDVSDQSDATYLETAKNSSWQDALFSTANHSGEGGTINWVRVHIRFKDTGLVLIYATVRTSMETNGTEYDGTEVTCSHDWQETYTEYTTNPQTGSAWTWSDIDSIQIGADGKRAGTIALPVKAQVAEVWLVVDYTPPPPWGSYNDAAHSSPDDIFSGDEHTVYMHGTGWTASHSYKVAYYDADGAKSPGANKIETDTDTVGDDGYIDSQCIFTDYSASADAGAWHAIVCDSGRSPPSTYDSGWQYTLADDEFTVEESAIPEFPTVIAGIGVAGMCAAIYWWMRRRQLAVGSRLSIVG